jgi:hypothetical protein
MTGTFTSFLGTHDRLVDDQRFLLSADDRRADRAVVVIDGMNVSLVFHVHVGRPLMTTSPLSVRLHAASAAGTGREQ